MSVIECRCLYGPGGAENIQKLKAVVKAYHSAEKQLVRAPAPFNIELCYFHFHVADRQRALRQQRGFHCCDSALHLKLGGAQGEEFPRLRPSRSQSVLSRLLPPEPKRPRFMWVIIWGHEAIQNWRWFVFPPSVATMQWNNLLEPEGNKTLDFMMPMKRIRCPSEKTPYLFTKHNSRSFYSLGKQSWYRLFVTRKTWTYFLSQYFTSPNVCQKLLWYIKRTNECIFY